MNRAPQPQAPPSRELRMLGAAALSWLLPGLGHIVAGDRPRGVLLIIVITLTYWTGVAIGGVKSTIDPKTHPIWFIAQICGGGHTIVALTWARALPDPWQTRPSPHRAVWPADDLGIVYTGVSGLMSVLVLLDAVGRAELAPAPRRASRAPPGDAPG